MATILELCGSLEPTTFAPGETLLSEGASTGLLFVLIDGEVEILKGTLQIDTVAEPGAVFGEISALLHVPHMASVRAVGATRAYRVENAVQFLEQNPGVALEVARLLAQRLSSVTSYLADLRRQFESYRGHLGLVDEVLEALVHQQRRPFTPGSDRLPDPTL
jgi:CRP/FNR family cyclic AMP-dependent transcriptional regulator